MHVKHKYSAKTIFALVITIIFWSSAFVGIRMGVEGYSPGALALLRFLIASVCMIFLYRHRSQRKESKRISRKDTFLLVIVGAIGLGIYHVALNYGELTVSAGISSFIISQSPLITMVLAFVFLKEKLTKTGLLGVFISIVGVGFITYGESEGGSWDMGVLYILVATIVGSLYSIMQKPFLGKYHAIDVTAYIIWGGTLSLILYFPSMLHEISQAPLSATLAVIYLGIFPGAIAYMAWSYALSAIPASKAVSFLYFMPVIATLLGWICLGEIPAAFALLGGAIALLGVWIANR